MVNNNFKLLICFIVECFNTLVFVNVVQRRQKNAYDCYLGHRYLLQYGTV